MKIVDIRATTIAMPLEAPLRHAGGAHWGRFIRTVVEVVTDEGIVGLGELGGGGESAEASVRGAAALSQGPRSAAARAAALEDHEPHRIALQQPAAGPCRDRDGVHGRRGQALGIRACDLLGGAVRERCRSRATSSIDFPTRRPARAARRRPTRSSRTPRTLVAEHGFKSHKLKGGVFHPDHDVEVFRALGAAFPKDGLRLDPNAAWSVEQAIRVGKAIEDLNNDYFEDPTWGLEGMRRLKQFVRIPTATNTVVVNFEQLAANHPAGGRRCRAARHDVLGRPAAGAQGREACCETFQYGASVHSSGEIGIQLASMLHLGAALPNLELRRRRPLPPPDRRHHQGRAR